MRAIYFIVKEQQIHQLSINHDGTLLPVYLQSSSSSSLSTLSYCLETICSVYVAKVARN